MAPILSDRSEESLDDAYLVYRNYRQAPKRRITLETVGWSLGIALMAYMLFAAIAGILYAG
jgi:hypothetical protein